MPRKESSWRTFKAFERPGSVDQKTGDLSLKSLTLNLQRQYRTFAEASPDELNTIPLRLESTRNLLKFSRVARSFSDSVADSGTPTRSTLAALAENPKAAVRFRMLAGALEDASRGPEEALAAAR